MGILFECDKDKCSACTACAVACMDQNDVDAEAGQAPFRKIIYYETPGGELVSCSIACMHCPDAPCVNACPTGCLYKDAETGLTLFDNTVCVGCHSCSMACPYGAPSFNADGKMVKCDGCVARLRAGLQPACVHACPTKALTVERSETGELPLLAKLYQNWSAIG